MVKKVSKNRKKRLAGEQERNAQRGKFFSMKGKQKAVIRLLPVPDDRDVGIQHATHYLNDTGYLCPNITYNKPCPACKAHQKLRQSTDPDKQKLADALYPTTRFAMPILDRGTKQVCIYCAPGVVYRYIFACFSDDGEDVADAYEGCDVRISKTGDGLQTQYSCRVLDESPLAPNDKKIKAIIAEAPTTKAEILAELGSSAGLEEAVRGFLPEGALDDNEDEEDDEPDEDSDEEDEEDEEDEAEDDDDYFYDEDGNPVAEDDLDPDAVYYDEEDVPWVFDEEQDGWVPQSEDDEEDEPDDEEDEPDDEEDESEAVARAVKGKGKKPVLQKKATPKKPAPKKPAPKKPAPKKPASKKKRR